MRMILQIKLTMDGRRVSTVMGNNKNKDEDKDKNNYLYSLIFNAFISIFLGAMLLAASYFSLLVFHSVFCHVHKLSRQFQQWNWEFFLNLKTHQQHQPNSLVQKH